MVLDYVYIYIYVNISDDLGNLNHIESQAMTNIFDLLQSSSIFVQCPQTASLFTVDTFRRRIPETKRGGKDARLGSVCCRVPDGAMLMLLDVSIVVILGIHTVRCSKHEQSLREDREGIGDIFYALHFRLHHSERLS